MGRRKPVRGSPRFHFLFGLTFLGVAPFHHHTLAVAVTGLITVTLYKIFFTGFKPGQARSDSFITSGTNVPPAYLVGFFVILAFLARDPDLPHKTGSIRGNPQMTAAILLE